MRQFHHIGLPTDDKQPGEVYVADTKVWVTDPRKHHYHVEYLRFEPDTPVKGPLRDLPHVAFRVDDIQKALEGHKVILGPFNPTPTLTVAFVEKDGAIFEFMQFESDNDLPWK
jgi:catechol 2,3-dioxygenase-like lactoylglutathione lyase family enzyme